MGRDPRRHRLAQVAVLDQRRHPLDRLRQHGHLDHAVRDVQGQRVPYRHHLHERAWHHEGRVPNEGRHMVRLHGEHAELDAARGRDRRAGGRQRCRRRHQRHGHAGSRWTHQRNARDDSRKSAHPCRRRARERLLRGVCRVVLGLVRQLEELRPLVHRRRLQRRRDGEQQLDHPHGPRLFVRVLLLGKLVVLLLFGRRRRRRRDRCPHRCRLGQPGAGCRRWRWHGRILEQRRTRRRSERWQQQFGRCRRYGVCRRLERRRARHRWNEQRGRRRGRRRLLRRWWVGQRLGRRRRRLLVRRHGHLECDPHAG